MDIKIQTLTPDMASEYIDFLITELLPMVILIKDVIVCGIIGQKSMNTREAYFRQKKELSINEITR